MRIPALLAALALAAAAPPALPAAEDFPSVVARVQKGTVLIEAQGRREVAFGTGFFLDSPSHVVTALHVVEGARRIRVAIPGTFQTSDALLVVGSSEWDLAVLKVSWPREVVTRGLSLPAGGGRLPPPGTEIAITGYGYGTDPAFARTLSTYRGIVSSHVPHGDGHMLHLSSLVSRGLSGSPLYLPATGEVVGVVTRHFGPPEMGFGYGGATPAGVLRRLLEGANLQKPAASTGPVLPGAEAAAGVRGRRPSP